VDAMTPRGAGILDAGCGPGRVGGALSAAGHQIAGADVAPEAIDVRELVAPGAGARPRTWPTKSCSPW
jgi:2-polyprenyl-3-methyl-5-hydroxy-6-metoxy-1,4-benzoquinol methylase